MPFDALPKEVTSNPLAGAMTPLHAERLRALARKMDRLESGKLQMNIWWGSWNWATTTPYAKDHECGTRACALGWACMIPELMAQGLVLKKEEDGDGYYPDFGGEKGIDAGQQFFGLTLAEAVLLFRSNAVDGRIWHEGREVAVAIKTILNKHGYEV